MKTNGEHWHLHLLLAIAALGATACAEELTWPPELPDGKTVATVKSAAWLEPPADGVTEGVAIAKAVPTVDFLYFDSQTYPGKPWSVWGDGLAAGDTYFTSIGDHLAPRGNAFVYAYEAKSKSLRLLTDVQSVINVPEPDYTPGKIHTRLTLGSDGWLYFATHRGSTRATIPDNGFTGSWILRCHPSDGRGEVVAHAPLPNQCLPTGRLDPARLIFYGGTAELNLQHPKLIQICQPDIGSYRCGLS